MRNQKGLTIIELLAAIVIIIIIAIVGYCNFKTSNADYRSTISDEVESRYPGAKWEILDTEYEDEDGDVEIDVLITLPSGKQFMVEYDCTCSCFGEGTHCRFDGIQD